MSSIFFLILGAKKKLPILLVVAILLNALITLACLFNAIVGAVFLVQVLTVDYRRYLHNNIILLTAGGLALMTALIGML